MQYYDITIAANGAQEIAANGNYVYFMPGGSAGGADTTITLRKLSGSETVLLKPGQGVRLNDDATGQVRWIVGNYKNQGTIIGQLLIGEGDFIDSRVSGSVEVIDGGKARTLANSAFMGAVNGTAVAGTQQNLQLWNPAGSGKNIIVEAVTVSSTVQNGFRMRVGDAAMSTQVAAGTSKRIGGAAASGLLKSQQFNGQMGTGSLMVMNLSANSPVTFKFTEPIVLVPGSGLNLAAGVAATDLAASYEWYEEGM